MKKYTTLLFFILIALQSIAQVPAYYDDVDLTLTGNALQTALTQKVTTTHTTFLSYTPGVWDALQQSDVNPSNNTEVLLIYGYDDTDGNPATDRTRDKNQNGGSTGLWNREHVYPKSLGNPNLGTTGPGADAHHVRPADVQMNSSRSNRKFADGTGNAGITAQGHFYPGDEWKGDVARMMLFMYVRYGNQCLPSAVGIGTTVASDSNMIDLFLDWNVADPVSSFELTRNEIIAGIQGNRNPFIDNPAFATQIWGGPQAEDRFGTGGDGDSTDPGTSAANELFISEYIEGSSFNKAIEIANFTGASVTLAGYSLRKQTNGSGDWSANLSLNGTIPHGEVYVIAHSSAAAAIVEQADVLSNDSALSFNGNDAVGLFKDGALIDIIGTFNGGSANFAKDTTLQRKEEISAPNTTYSSTEWNSFASDTFSGLGSHTVAETSNPDTEAPTAPQNLQAAAITDSSFQLTWSPSTDNVGVVSYEVRLSGVMVQDAAITVYDAVGLQEATTYEVLVIARDEAGNLSAASTLSVTTESAPEIGGCAGGITNYPYAVSFESSLDNWIQHTDDDIDWTRDAAGTPSSGTGPSSGSQGAFYLFVEASGNGTGYPNKQAIITSPCFDLTGISAATFSFDYHANGTGTMGTIATEISIDDGITWTSIWSRSTYSGTNWQSQILDLSAYENEGIQLRFNRITGDTWRADVAIDNIQLNVGGTPPVDPPLSYCASNGNNTSDEYIQRVQINTLDHSTGASNGGYGDFTEQEVTLNETNDMIITPLWTGTIYSEGYAVFIDWNHDGDFNDATETVYTQNATTATLITATFTIPSTAITGATRMRVSMKYNGIPSACESFPYGEVEDYTVIIPASKAAFQTHKIPLTEIEHLQNEPFDVHITSKNKQVQMTTLYDKSLTVRVYNTLGQEVWRGDLIQRKSLALPATGVYIVQVYNEERVLHKKILVQ